MADTSALEKTPHDEGTGHGEHPSHPGPKLYGLIFLALMVCTGLTVGAAFIDMGVFNPMVALGIAIFKATIVVLFFMHVRYSSKLTKMTVSAGFFMLLVLFTMTLTDYMSRAWGLW